MRYAADLGARERVVYRGSFEDGLLEVFGGTALALIGVAWLCDLVALGPVAPVLLLPFWPIARRRITEPRIGFSRPRPERAARERRSLLALVGLGLGVLAAAVAVFLVVRAGRSAGGADLVRGLPGALVGLGTLVAAATFGLPRLLLAAGLLVAAGAAAVRWRFDPGWSLVGGGLANAALGLVLLARFVIRHPVVAADETR